MGIDLNQIWIRFNPLSKPKIGIFEFKEFIKTLVGAEQVELLSKLLFDKIDLSRKGEISKEQFINEFTSNENLS